MKVAYPSVGNVTVEYTGLCIELRFYGAIAILWPVDSMAPMPTSWIGHTADSSGHAVALPIIFARTSGFYLFIFEPSLLVPTVGKVLVLCSPVALDFFFYLGSSDERQLRYVLVCH